MPPTTINDMKYTFGQKLIIELISSEIYEGEYISGSNTRLDLNNVSEYGSSSSNLQGTTTFYKSEISSIRVTNTDTEEIAPSTKSSSDIIKIPQCEYERLKEVAINPIYIASIDSRYFEAVDNLINMETIGLVCVGKIPGRCEPLNLLLMSTWKEVYIFDIKMFNKQQLPKELKYILMSSDVRKVIHDARAVVDCFEYCYKVRIENIFDTQMADVVVRGKNINNENDFISIGECLTSHFNFPDTLLDKAMGLEIPKWQERPLNTGKKALAAQLAVYLIKLKTHLENLLLKDFYVESKKRVESTLGLTAAESRSRLCEGMNKMTLQTNGTTNGNLSSSSISER